MDCLGLVYRGGSWFGAEIRGGRPSFWCAAFLEESEGFSCCCALEGGK